MSAKEVCKTAVQFRAGPPNILQGLIARLREAEPALCGEDRKTALNIGRSSIFGNADKQKKMGS